MFSIIWISISVLLIISIIFLRGYEVAKQPFANHHWVDRAVLVAILWPIVLGCLVIAPIIIAPFYGIYWLGKYVGKK